MTSKSSKSSSSEQVILELRSGIAWIFLGQPEESVIILSEKRMTSLKDAIEETRKLAKSKEVKGLVIAGAHSKLFCAGADINVISEVSTAKVGKRLAKEGQEVFQLIEDLPIRTVAAVSGACVGGGCELVLACDFRILADHPGTRIGLPEVKLGILPGFGGTQRLPRLIGIKPALGMILKGRLSNAIQAKKAGLADEIVSEKGLLSLAEAVARGKRIPPEQKPGLFDKFVTKVPLALELIKKQTLKSVNKTTKGHYPAPLKAIESVFNGLSAGLKSGYDLEAKFLGELIITPECKGLVHLYFLTENSVKVGKSAKKNVSGGEVGVIGAGTMGAGIVAAFLISGMKVTLVDTSEEALAKAKSRIEKIINKKRSFNEQKKAKCLENLNLTVDLSSFSSAMLVIEAIVEDLEIKRSVLSKVEGIVEDDCILATNTSSLSVSDIQAGLARPKQVIGMHFFNPAEKMQLVELVRGKKTSTDSVVLGTAVVDEISKYPVIVEDVAGFLVNRVLTPYLVEAAYLFSEGFSVKEIDGAAVDFGMPMGPLRLLDEIGLDIAAKVCEIIESAYGTRMQGPKLAEELVAKGYYGKKSSKGFYLYDEKGKASVNPEIKTLLEINDSKARKTNKEDIQKRLIYAFLNEAVRCLDEKVCGKPGKESAGQIDLASVMGTGFPPFRGGVISYADAQGAKVLYKELRDFAKTYGERFEPAPGIKDRAKSNKGFC